MKQFSGLRSRILLLLLFIMLPVLFLLFYSAFEQRQEAVKALKQGLTTNVRILSGLMAQKIEGVRQLLIALSHEQAVLQRDATSCNKLLAEIKVDFPEYVNVGVTDSKGNIFCSAVPITKPVNSSDLVWFRNAIESHDIGLGEYQIGRITGKQILNIGYAARDSSDKIQAVVYAPFYLDALNELLGKIKLTPETVLIMLDRNGTLLARRPDHEKWVGKTVGDSELIKAILTQHEGLIEAKGDDGIKRVYSFIPVAGTDHGIFISAGIPKDIALSDINRLFTRNLILFGMIAFLSFAAVWIISRLARQSEENLVKRTEEFQDLYDNAPNGYLSVGADGLIKRGNSRLCEMLGYGTEKLLGMPVFNLYADTLDGKEKAKKLFHRFLSGETILNEELRMHKADGTLLWISLSVNAVRDSQGRILESRSIVQDISKRKKTEEALQRNEQLLRLFVEHSPAAIAMLDHDMKYIVASHRFLMDYNLGDQNLIGRSHYEVFPEIPDHWREIHRRCLAGSVEKSEEDPFVRADGKMDWVRWEIRPWYANQGDIGGIILFSEVITERKRAEKALQESEERLRLSTELANVAVWEYSFMTNSMSRSQNHDQLYGLKWQTRWDINTFLNATHPDDRGFSNEIIQKSVAAGGPDQYEFDFRVVYPDQSIHWLMVVGQVVERNSEGQGTIVRGCLIDINGRKKAEEELRKLNVELDQRVKNRTAELEAKITEIERMNKIFVGRELRMIELKERIKELEKKNPESRSQ